MYAHYFGLREAPFRRIAVVGQVYLGSAFEAAWSELIGSLRGGAHGVLLTGARGTGKTRMLLHLRTSIAQEQPVYYLSCCPLGVQGFIGSAASALRIKLTSERDVDVSDAFREALAGLAQEGKPPLILIDDADGLNEEVLGALVSLFDLGTEAPLARVVLAGSPRMAEGLSLPALAALGECVSPRIELAALEREEVGAYIRFALEMVGHRGPDLFSPEAVARVAAQTQGIIHQINVLGAAAMSVAHDRDERWVTEDTVLVAIRDVMGLELPEDGDELPAPSASLSDAGPRLGQDWWEAEYLFEDDPVETWLRRSRPWRFAAMGLGGSVAVAAMLVLLGLFPFGPTDAAAKQRGHLAAKVDLDEHIATLSEKLETAVTERGHLEARLAHMRTQRQLLAQSMGVQRAGHRPESVADFERLPGLALDIENDEHFWSLRAEFEGGKTKSEKREASARVVVAPMPKPRPDAAAAPAAGDDGAPSYVVQDGDNLWRIASRHGLSIEELLAINGISDANLLYTGQRLRLVEEATADVTMEVAAAPQLPEREGHWYEVRAGDSLYGIGRKTNTDPLDLKRWNQLADADHLIVGQRIQLVPGDI